MKKSVEIMALAALAFAAAPAQASQPEQEVSAREVDELVVIGRRSGIPIWRVYGPETSVVVVGDLAGVSRGTRWDPDSLTEALLRADRIMYPGRTDYRPSVGALLSIAPRWLRHSNLPKGRSLAQMMPADQFQRLVALRDRGILKDGFERRHPFHLALGLLDHAIGSEGFGLDAGDYVKRVSKRRRLNLVPVPRASLKSVFDDLFATSAQSHVECLLHMVTLVEGGPALMKARSDAWAARRIPDLMRSPAERISASCWPAHLDVAARPHQRETIIRLLGEREVTVAVIDIRSLAVRGGILDDLASRGIEISGPDWRH